MSFTAATLLNANKQEGLPVDIFQAKKANENMKVESAEVSVRTAEGGNQRPDVDGKCGPLRGNLDPHRGPG